MLKALLHITMPDDDGEDRHFAPVVLAVEAMVSVNLWHIRRAKRRYEKGETSWMIPPLYSSGVYYKEDPPGEENWKDVYQVLKDGHGDCIPLSSLVLRDDYEMVRFGTLRPGDKIMGDGAWTEVTAFANTGEKELLEFRLSNGRALRCSPDHRLFRVADSANEELQARSVRVGDDLLSRDRKVLRVASIVSGGRDVCGDITTNSGRFWLPESDVLVHNCDRLVAWRVAELLAAGFRAEPVIKWQQIPKDICVRVLGYPEHLIGNEGLSMIHVLVRFPDRFDANGEPIIEDPSKILGMGGDFTGRV